MEEKFTVSWSVNPDDTRHEETCEDFDTATKLMINVSYELYRAGTLRWVKIEVAS